MKSSDKIKNLIDHAAQTLSKIDEENKSSRLPLEKSLASGILITEFKKEAMFAGFGNSEAIEAAIFTEARKNPDLRKIISNVNGALQVEEARKGSEIFDLLGEIFDPKKNGDVAKKLAEQFPIGAIFEDDCQCPDCVERRSKTEERGFND